MNLSTHYLGLKLCSPFVVGASPFCDHVDLARRLQDAGAGALVMRSLFEEQFAPAPPRPARSPANGSDAADFPETADYQLSPETYLRQLTMLKGTVSIPVIASLNAVRPGAWVDFAPRLERAGADAIELNFYQVVTDVSVAADQVETEMLEMVGLIAASVSIPVAVKLSPFHSALAQFAAALEPAGAAGVVMFNRFYQPDINTTDLEVHSSLRLSTPDEILLRLRWLAIISPNFRGSLIAAGGFHSADDAVKAFLAGAHAVQLVSVLLRHGPSILRTFVQGLATWMKAHGHTELEEFRGSLNLQRCRDASAFERANYLKALQTWKV